MKKYCMLIAFILFSSLLFGQTNFFPATGSVGIGTLSPLNALHVYTNSDLYGIITGDGENSNLRITGTAEGATGYGVIQTFIGGSTKGGVLSLQRGGGNVGIGTGTPTEKLSVNGKIRAHEVKVETANWPDYVFAKDYQLPSLQETEQHIKEKGHLSGIPSAEEVKANGINLGEMNAKLLKKIEELTLHLIEQEKKNETQAQVMQKMEKRLLNLETKR
jgi:hypothetical protein